MRHALSLEIGKAKAETSMTYSDHTSIMTTGRTTIMMTTIMMRKHQSKRKRTKIAKSKSNRESNRDRKMNVNRSKTSMSEWSNLPLTKSSAP